MTIDWPVGIAVVLLSIGLVNICFIRRNMSWYKTLNRPKFMPPLWIFAPVWTTLYYTMGYSSYLVWRDGGGFQEPEMICGFPNVYSFNLALVILNSSWLPIFFELRSIKWAFYESVALSVITLILGIHFYTVNSVAGYLMIPYFIWRTLVVLFTYVIYRDNKQLPTIEDTEEKKKPMNEH